MIHDFWHVHRSLGRRGRHASRCLARAAARLVPSSLGGRLLIGSTTLTAVALLVTMIVMQSVLTRFVTGQIDQRLDNKILTLASQVKVDPEGLIRIDGDTDGPPFDGPRHDAFWVVAGPRNVLRTHWLRPDDVVLPSSDAIDVVAEPPRPMQGLNRAGRMNDGRPRTISLAGSNGQSMHVRVARLSTGATPILFYVAAPMASIAGPMREAMTPVALAMISLAIALSIATVAQVRFGLRPLGRVRRQIAAVRAGDASDVPLDQPHEILPLVVELNSLLDQNASNLARARRHVANLAHGLKTPLATMALGLDRMGSDEAGALRDLVMVVERRIRHHLGRARSAALEGPARARTPIAPCLRDLIDALAKIHADRTVTVFLECAADLAVACEAQDIDEILGNLLDNAYKFTSSLIDCRATAVEAAIVVTIADDGPGLAPSDLLRVQERGQRLDEAVPGHGFGLPIARELAELYGGEVTLRAGKPGLVVTLRLPRAR